eukprot:gene3461-13520_t
MNRYLEGKTQQLYPEAEINFPEMKALREKASITVQGPLYRSVPLGLLSPQARFIVEMKKASITRTAETASTPCKENKIPPRTQHLKEATLCDLVKEPSLLSLIACPRLPPVQGGDEDHLVVLIQFTVQHSSKRGRKRRKVS